MAPSRSSAPEAALSLGHLARSAGIDKSQMSRVVSGLAKRRLVLREAHRATDAACISPSRSGRKLYDGLIRAAAERDHAFRNCLFEGERRLRSRLGKLASQARALIENEKAQK